MRRRRRAHKRAKKYNRDEDWSQCKTLRKEINKELQDSFNQHINGLLDPPEQSSGSSKKFYSFIKSQKQESFGVGTLRADGQIGATSKEKADMCNRQFHSAFSNEQGPAPAPDGEPLPSMCEITVTEEGVIKLLQGLNPNKATGPDGIPGRVLRECATSLTPFVTALFNQSLREGQVPEDWKQQRVSPVFKKGSRSDPAN